jgi:hypothetical protein
MLDVDGLLWFLALDCALINTDGYWIRASDYSLYRDPEGKFHVIPHDMNEAFTTPHGPGMVGFRGPGGGGRDRRGPEENPAGSGSGPVRRTGPDAENFGASSRNRPDGPPEHAARRNPNAGAQIPAVKGVELDPLVGLDDTRKPLRSRLLAVPSLRTRYLANVRTLAEQWLDWKNLGPIVAKYRALIEKEVEADTRKLTTLGAFQKATGDELPIAQAAPGEAPRRGHARMSLRAFADQRRAYLLSHPAVKSAPASVK